MKERVERRAVSQVARIAGLLILFCGLLTPVSIGDDTENVDPCELRALEAYVKALRLCELAQDSNPRMRCYEAAREVYFAALADCPHFRGDDRGR